MKICIIGYEISNVFKGEILGGAQKQMALFVKGLKEKGFTIIVLEYYRYEFEVIDGVEFYPAWNKDDKSFFKKINSIYKQSKDVDIIYSRGTQLYVGILFFLLKLKGAKTKLFWGIAGDHDLTSKLNYLRVNHADSLYGKINAGIIFNITSMISFFFSDMIICQTDEQMKRCESIWKKKPKVLISNIYIPIDNKPVTNERIADLIWIGKFSGNKGEDVLLKIALELPELKILCLGHVTEQFEKLPIYKRIKKQNNLILKGRVPVSDIALYISQVDFILNTSPSEGLSNVFLEGWDFSKPVISYKVNPNEYLTKGGAGFCAEGSIERLIHRLKSIRDDHQFLEKSGKKGNEILIENHLPEVIIPKYIKLFQQN